MRNLWDNVFKYIVVIYLCYGKFGFGGLLERWKLPHLKLLKDFREVMILTDRDPVSHSECVALLEAGTLVTIIPPSSTASGMEGLSFNSLPIAVLVIYEEMRAFVKLVEQVFLRGNWNHFYFFAWPTPVIDVEFVQLIRNVSLDSHPLNSEVYWFLNEKATTNSVTPMLWESYSLKDMFVVQRIYNHLENTHLMDLVNGKWRRRGDFRGLPITATAVADPDYEDEVKFTDRETGEKVLESGFAVEVYRIFRDQLNFVENSVEGDYLMVQGDSRKAPRMDLQLWKGFADMSITESVITEDKARVVQMLHATTADWLEARILPGSISRLKFHVKPFTGEVWGVIFVHLFILMITFYLLQILLRRIQGSWRNNEEFSSIFLGILWAIGTICLKGFYRWPRSRPMRVLILVGSGIGGLVNSLYVAVMTSQLSVRERLSLSLDTLLDLNYKFYIEEDVNFPVDLKAFPHWEQVSVSVISNSSDFVGITGDVEAASSAVISFPEYFQAAMTYGNISDAESCRMYEAIRVSRVPTLCAMAVNKTSPFKEIFNVKTLDAMNRGLLYRLYLKYKRQSILQCEDSREEHVRQTVSELFLAYAVLLGGNSVAILILLGEQFPMLKLRRLVSSAFLDSLWRSFSGHSGKLTLELGPDNRRFSKITRWRYNRNDGHDSYRVSPSAVEIPPSVL